MTSNQINYAKLQEDIRTHMANEEIGRRQARASETQAYASTVSANAAAANARTNAILAQLQEKQIEINQRAQAATERYQEWQYRVSSNQLLETQRHNTAMESETNRHNTQTELLTSAGQTNDYNIAQLQAQTSRQNAVLGSTTNVITTAQQDSNRTVNTLITTLGNIGTAIVKGVTDVAVSITRGANKALLN